MKVTHAPNLVFVAAMLIGLVTIAAGASVPSEQTMTLGFFVLLTAAACLAGLNWPKRKVSLPKSVVKMRRQPAPVRTHS